VFDNSAVALVIHARDGDERAWAALVERYAPLVWSLCRRYRLDTTDTAYVGQNVWLLLVSELGKIREPAALPGWLASTTRRECQRVLNRGQVRQGARHESDAENILDGEAKTIEQGLLAVERHVALHEAFTHLAPRDQQLIALLIEDPPVPYAEISIRLGIPVGSIGPNRRRCLDKLRHHPAITTLISAKAQTA
jgi:RNA polymerase sigma factor (sigma-70 family)